MMIKIMKMVMVDNNNTNNDISANNGKSDINNDSKNDSNDTNEYQ